MAVKMSMTSDMKVTEVKDEITNTESQITSIVMEYDARWNEYVL